MMPREIGFEFPGEGDEGTGLMALSMATIQRQNEQLSQAAFAALLVRCFHSPLRSFLGR